MSEMINRPRRFSDTEEVWEHLGSLLHDIKASGFDPKVSGGFIESHFDLDMCMTPNKGFDVEDLVLEKRQPDESSEKDDEADEEVGFAQADAFRNADQAVSSSGREYAIGSPLYDDSAAAQLLNWLACADIDDWLDAGYVFAWAAFLASAYSGTSSRDPWRERFVALAESERSLPAQWRERLVRVKKLHEDRDWKRRCEGGKSLQLEPAAADMGSEDAKSVEEFLAVLLARLTAAAFVGSLPLERCPESLGVSLSDLLQRS